MTVNDVFVGVSAGSRFKSGIERDAIVGAIAARDNRRSVPERWDAIEGNPGEWGLT